MFMTSLELEAQNKEMNKLEFDLKCEELERLRKVHEDEIEKLIKVIDSQTYQWLY